MKSTTIEVERDPRQDPLAGDSVRVGNEWREIIKNYRDIITCARIKWTGDFPHWKFRGGKPECSESISPWLYNLEAWREWANQKGAVVEPIPQTVRDAVAEEQKEYSGPEPHW